MQPPAPKHANWKNANQERKSSARDALVLTQPSGHQKGVHRKKKKETKTGESVHQIV